MVKAIVQPPVPKSPYGISEARRQELMAIAQAMSGGRVPPEPPLKRERY